MLFRMFSVAALALVMFVGAPELAAQDAKPNTHDGILVSINGDKLMMTDMKGQEHSHTLAADAKVTLDGKACQVEDLQADTKIRVTTQTSDAKFATRIEAIDKNESFAKTYDGNVISITGNKLVMTGLQDKAEQAFTLTDDVQVSCDGKDCKSSDLKSGMMIRVTYDSDDGPHKVIRIEALDKNLKFASL